MKKIILSLLCLLLPVTSFAKDWWGNYENDDDKNGLAIMVREKNGVKIILSKDGKQCRQFVYINGKGKDAGNKLQISSSVGNFTLQANGKNFQLIPNIKPNTKFKWEGDCGNETSSVDNNFVNWIKSSKLQFNERDI